MNAIIAQTQLKFHCLYCGQHMECAPGFSGRQMLCPACRHRIVIPAPRGGGPARRSLPVVETWDKFVPLPELEIPTRHGHTTPSNPALARLAE
jgi:DNA-directed RNA polymerase subunit RPC12/RpoP